MRYAIGIDLGGTNIAAGIVDEEYRLLEHISVPTGAERPWQQVVADMSAAVKRLREKSALDAKDCVGLGVGVPGAIDSTDGVVLYANNLHWLRVPLSQTLQEQTGLSTRLSNDANCAALGEAKAGAAKGCQDVVMVTLGTGVGGGIVIDGKIYEGVRGVGAELGHSTLIMNGVACTCGRKGCAESYASATALIREAHEALDEHPESLLSQKKIDARWVYDAMRAGDATATEVVRQYEEYVGEFLVNITNIFRPEMILLGGGISGEGAPLTDRLSEYVRKHCYGGDVAFVTPIRTATLGNKAGIVGAAALAL